jgi:large subunit ribosomal protein L20
MPRVKRSVAARKRRKRVLKKAKGYYGARSKLYGVAREAVEKAALYAYSGRKQRKRQFRALWIARINAASREHGLSYSRLISGLKVAGVEIDRKILAQLAVDDPESFGELAELAKKEAA